MTEKRANLQDHFLNAVRRAHQPVSIFVTKGVKLQGLIPWFDAFSVLLRRDGQEQLVYKHSISTIMPAGELPGFSYDLVEMTPDASLQDRFLFRVAEERAPVTMFLVNGVMLQGEIAGFDQYCVVLRRGHLIQLVYKHAISTIQPSVPVRIGRENADDRQVEAAD